MTKVDDLSRSLAALDQDSTLIARRPLKKLAAEPEAVRHLLERWRGEALKAGRRIKRVAVAFEAGRDGFWLARWLRERGIEAHVIHPASVAVSREHRRAKTDRLDTELLMRAFLGWLRGERKHCQMCLVPSLADEDGRRPGREHEALTRERTRLVNRIKATMGWLGIAGFNAKLRRATERLAELRTPDGLGIPPNTQAELRRAIERLRLIRQQIKEIETERLERLERTPAAKPQAAMLLLQRIVGLGLETADTLTNEVLLRDRRAVGRYGGITGAPDESGAKRREKGLARAGNARVRQTMIQLAWRWLMFQKDSALARWYRERTENASKLVRKKMIVALARKLLIALWRYVTDGVVPEGAVLRPAAA